MSSFFLFALYCNIICFLIYTLWLISCQSKAHVNDRYSLTFSYYWRCYRTMNNLFITQNSLVDRSGFWLPAPKKTTVFEPWTSSFTIYAMPSGHLEGQLPVCSLLVCDYASNIRLRCFNWSSWRMHILFYIWSTGRFYFILVVHICLTLWPVRC